MSLSNVLASLPKHEITLPTSGIKVEYRPFLVKEEKILLMAAESKDEKTMNLAVRDVILACTNGKVDTSTLPIVDMEYLFLQLRSKSIGETVKPGVKCSACENPNEISINLQEIVPITTKSHKKTIPLIGNIVVEMKHPTIDSISASGGNITDVERAFLLVTNCIDKVFVGDTVYVANEVGMEEVTNFVEQLTQEQFSKLMNFFETMPRIEKEVSFTCKCGKENKITMKGLASFFS